MVDQECKCTEDEYAVYVGECPIHGCPEQPEREVAETLWGSFDIGGES